MRIISLDYLTVAELTPPELVRTAADAGYTHVGLRLKSIAPGESQQPIVGDTPMRRETLAALRDTGVGVLDWGVLRLDGDTVVADFEPWLDTAACLGALNAMVNGYEPDEGRLTELLAELCELGERYAMSFHFEPTPWTGLKTLAQASRIVADVAKPNAKVLIDTIHLDRVGGTAADIAALPAEHVGYAQVCDGYMPRPEDRETMIFQARSERAFPGEGGIDLVSMLRALPSDAPLSLECPTRYRALGSSALERARRGRAAMEQLLSKL